MRELSLGYAAEVDAVDEQTWYEFLREFDDANIFQTWACGMVMSGRRNMSHLVVRKNGELAAVAQAKIVKIPFVKVGVAYVRWGPLWEVQGTGRDVESFRQALRALRNEYVCKRGLVLRVFPNLYEDDDPCLLGILEQEGFLSSRNGVQDRTILMDVSPPLETLREGMKNNSRRNLKTAERGGLEIVEGSGNHLFEPFLNIYSEMVSRKRFVPGADVDQYRLMQDRLPDDFKMKISLCRSEEGVCAGLISSAMGRSAVYLFGATANGGMKSGASHLLHWKLIQALKRRGVSIYDLYGINPKKNPGTYRFKSEFSGKNGREVSSLGRFDAHASFFDYSCVELGDSLRMRYRKIREIIGASDSLKLWARTAH